jgi:hypothetical protein
MQMKQRPFHDSVDATEFNDLFVGMSPERQERVATIMKAMFKPATGRKALARQRWELLMASNDIFIERVERLDEFLKRTDIEPGKRRRAVALRDEYLIGIEMVREKKEEEARR